jgi:hypothetical protein
VNVLAHQDKDRKQGSVIPLLYFPSVISCHGEVLTWRGYLNKKGFFEKPSCTPEFIIAPQEDKFDSFKKWHPEKGPGINQIHINEILCLLQRFKIAMENQSCRPVNVSHLL